MTAADLRATDSPFTVLKLGGELLESDARAAELAPAIAALAAACPLVIVHGGGKDIDAEVTRRGLTKQTVDGLRITDAATRDAVVAALAGTVNTRLVAALSAAGMRAVGLTGADAGVVPARKAPAHHAVDGRVVDLGLVGEPALTAMPELLLDLLLLRYVPVLACIAWSEDGTLLNVNADTLAAAIAKSCGARRLIIAGATSGVLDADGSTIAHMDLPLLDAMIQDGRASAGMVAKLRACRDATDAGVNVSILDARGITSFAAARGTQIASAVRL